LLDWANIKRPFTTSADGRTSDQVEIRLQNTPEGYIVFIINHSSVNEDVAIHLNVKVDGMYTLRDVLSETSRVVKSDGNTLTIEIGVDSKDVKVIEIKR